jgi:hypothetical protein
MPDPDDPYTHPCPQCGKKMLLIPTGKVMASDPPGICQEYRCGCGYRLPATTKYGKSVDELFMRAWEQENRG